MLVGSYRASGVTSASGSVFSNSIINITGFKPSGISAGNLMGCALYIFSGSLETGSWQPLRRKWL